MSLLVALLAALASRVPEFPVFVWCQDHAGRELPAELLEPFGGVNVEGADEAHWVVANDVPFYVGHAPGREVLHLDRSVEWYDRMWRAFFESRDTSKLIRQPCLSDPATLARAKAQLDRSLEARDGAYGQAVSLGDEVGLTPWGDPLDLCQSKHCTKRWVAWQKERGLDVDASWPATDAVRLAYADGDPSLIARWLNRRHFHQDIVLEFLEALAAHARAKAPGAPIATFGLTGQTAFGGVSIARLLPTLDVLEAYHEGVARELLFTLRTDERAWCTLFPAAGDSDRGAHRLWQHWLRGGDGAIVWSDRELRKSKAYLERLGKAVADVRAVDAQFPSWRPETRGAAVLHDPDSIALAWLRDALSDGPTWPKRFQGHQAEHGTRERAVRGTLRLLEDCGFLPGTLPLDMIDAETVRRFPLLVAVHQLVLDADEEARLDAYLSAGGKLLLRGPFALYDGTANKSEETAEQRFLSAYPERVKRLATDRDAVFDYDAHRIGSRDARTGSLREELLMFSDPPNRAAEWQIDCSPKMPLLIAEQTLDDDRVLCVVQPNLPKGKLAVVQLTLETGLTPEWIHPPGEANRIRLSPGDAAVFLLRTP